MRGARLSDGSRVAACRTHLPTRDAHARSPFAVELPLNRAEVPDSFAVVALLKDEPTAGFLEDEISPAGGCC